MSTTVEHSGGRVIFAALMPHAPILVPEVGRDRCAEVSSTIASMREVARRTVAAGGDVLILMSPHSPRQSKSFGIWAGGSLGGSLAQFDAPDARVELPAAKNLADEIAREARRHEVSTWWIKPGTLDHGAIVPLWFLTEAGWSGPTVVLSLNYPGEGGLEEFGRVVSASAGHARQKVAFVASGDMSHRLRPGAPAGYHPAAEGFDRQFMEWIRAGSYQSLSRCDPELQDLAAEDVVDSTLVAAAAVDWKADGHEVLSYEGPFGVGYGVAVLYDSRAKPADAGESDLKHELSTDPFLVLPRIARQSVEAALDGSKLTPIEPENETLKQPCAVFVTIRDFSGELRGCVGTLSPKHANVVEETRHMAKEAAFSDHRFTPVQTEEISRLHFEVSVLGPLQEASLDDLDPKRYGVVVTAEDGRRGALLPGIREVHTVDEQIRIARKKAGIASWELATIMRFETEKYAESDRGSATG